MIILIYFLFLHKNISCGFSYGGVSNEYLNIRCMEKLRKLPKNYHQILSLISSLVHVYTVPGCDSELGVHVW